MGMSQVAPDRPQCEERFDERGTWCGRNYCRGKGIRRPALAGRSVVCSGIPVMIQFDKNLLTVFFQSDRELTGWPVS